jgi:hypothetical protein
MTELDRRLLERLNLGPIQLGTNNISEFAKSLGTTSILLAEAKNTLRDAGFCLEDCSVFAAPNEAGGVSLSITDSGRAILRPVQVPWWKRLLNLR